MNKLSTIFYIFCLFIKPSQAQNIIHQVYDFNILINEIKNLDKNSLVIFDVGNVIMYRTDKCFNNLIKSIETKDDVLNKYKKHLISKKINRKLREEKRSLLWSNLKAQAKKKLVDPCTPILIKKLQKKEIKTIALTRIGKVPNKKKAKSIINPDSFKDKNICWHLGQMELRVAETDKNVFHSIINELSSRTFSGESLINSTYFRIAKVLENIGTKKGLW